MIIIRVVRELPYPLAASYAWLTDFRDDDTERTDAVTKKRRVVESSGKRVVLEGESEAFGRRVPFASEVDLAPPDAWTARVVGGPRQGSVTTYKLTPSARGTRLEVVYRLTHEKAWARAVMTLGKAKLRADLVRMWEGYERAMAKDLAA